MDQLIVHPIFTGLTRPAMIVGVTVDYLSICVMVAMIGFILGNSPLYLMLYVPMHIVGYIACKFDPFCFRIVFKRLSCAYMPNKKIWNCASYEPC